MDIYEELKKLPHRAVVAFAVRCAMRVRPLANRGLDVKGRASVAQAIEIATDFSRGNEVDRAYAARAAADARAYADMYAHVDAAAADAARAASAAAAAAAASDAASAYDAYDAAYDNHAEYDAAEYDSDADYHDLLRLQRLNLGEPGTLDEPIDPSEDGSLGPLWPGEAPEWFTNPPETEAAASYRLEAETGEFKIEHPEPTAPPITLYFDTVEFTDEEIANILTMFSDLYRSIGGDALVIDRTETLDPALALTPEEV